MATHPPSAPLTSASGGEVNKNTASMLMEDDTFDVDEALLAAAVDSIIENHNRESEKVGRERGRESGEDKKCLLSPFSIDQAAKRTQRDPPTFFLLKQLRRPILFPFNTQIHKQQKNRRPEKERQQEQAREPRRLQTPANSDSSSSSRARLLVPPLFPLRRQRSPVPPQQQQLSPLTWEPEPRQRLQSLRRSLRVSEGLLSGCVSLLRSFFVSFFFSFP